MKTYWRDSIFTGKKVKIALVEVFDEPVDVMGVKFHMNNYYEALANSIDRPHDYSEPVHDSDFNTKRAFAKYRMMTGLLQPKEIKHVRKSLKLSQADVAFLVGMSVATLSKLENGDVVQSALQDTAIRSLLKACSLAPLVQARLKMYHVKPRKYVNTDHLKNAVKIIRNIEKEQ